MSDKLEGIISVQSPWNDLVLCKASHFFISILNRHIFRSILPHLCGIWTINSRMVISYKETLLKNRTKEEG